MVRESPLSRLIRQAEATGRYGLDHSDCRVLLEEYGLPFVPEYRVRTREEALEAAQLAGFPVALKGVGPGLAHKTESGLVRLNISDQGQLAEAFEAIGDAGGSALDGMLLQPHIEGKREFVAGLYRDPLFGPVVLFGLGGIHAEALQDVSLRLAPVTAEEARDMLRELRSSGLLGDFRGERAADRETLVNVLLALSRLGETQDRVREIDLNPLIVDREGSVFAVDAWGSLDSGQSRPQAREPADQRRLARLLQPRSLAFVGASSRMGKWGHVLPVNVKSGGFPGPVYLVNPGKGRIAGSPAYPSVLDLPEPVDLAVITVPAAAVPEVIRQCGAKGIECAVLVTSGFAETGDQGREAEESLVREAKRHGVLLLGPNTMGICNPSVSLYCMGFVFHPRPGPSAMVSQSGNMGVQLLSFAGQQGIGISSFCGSGNEAMVTVEDLLEHYREDERTNTLMLYVESVRDGQRFYRSARSTAEKKPVILLRGGESAAGSKAASSHTGAMSSDARVFRSLCRQAGITRAGAPSELLDLCAAFASLPLPRGNRVAVMTFGGGWGVITADLCEASGLVLPELPPELIREADRHLPPYWSRGNPLDLVGEEDPSLPITILDLLMRWQGCDAVINLGVVGRRILTGAYARAAGKVDPDCDAGYLQRAKQRAEDLEQRFLQTVSRLMDETGKPVYGVRLASEDGDRTVVQIPEGRYSPVFYQTPERAVQACAEMYNYYYFLERNARTVASKTNEEG
jgi:acyl-CoA synthetase (NDP forming)